MQADQVDALAKLLARATSRRAALKTVLAAALGGFLAGTRGRAQAGMPSSTPDPTQGPVSTAPRLRAGPQTLLRVTNRSGADVETFITLGPTPGCVANVRRLPFVTNVLKDLQGSFTLRAGQSVDYTPPPGQCINGNYSFGSPPLNCPPAEFLNGINLAEFNLNNGAQGAGAQETLDNSGVSGINASITYVMTGGGAWNGGLTQPHISSFQNQGLHQNVGLVGVYPWGCDTCTARTAPPVCSTPYDGACQSEQICNVQRDASSSGGTVEIIFNGFLT